MLEMIDSLPSKLSAKSYNSCDYIFISKIEQLKTEYDKAEHEKWLIK